MTKTTSREPISIRLTPQERADLVRRAGSRSVSAYVRELVFAGRAGSAKPHKSELARLARLGALPVSDETQVAMRTAGADIAAMKAALMRALGVKER